MVAFLSFIFALCAAFYYLCVGLKSFFEIRDRRESPPRKNDVERRGMPAGYPSTYQKFLEEKYYDFMLASGSKQKTWTQMEASNDKHE